MTRRWAVPALRRAGAAIDTRDAAILALLTLLPFLLFPAEALGRRVFFHQDVQYYFYPYRRLAMETIADGHLPLWNPYAFSGLPLLGDGQTAIFYPPNWLLWLLPAAWALTTGILLQFSIAGVGTYLYARRLAFARPLAALAALIVMFDGFLVARVVHPSIMAGAALIPLTFWGYERLLQRGGARAFVAAVVAVAMQLVAGHPQVPIYTAVALGVYALTIALHESWWRRGRDNLRRTLRPPVLLAGVYLAAGLLAAVQLLPWFELSALSPRAAAASFPLVVRQSLVGVDWLLFLFPFGFGGLRQSWLQSLPVDASTHIYLWERLAYVGLLPLALAGIGLARLVAGMFAGSPSAHPAGPAPPPGDPDLPQAEGGAMARLRTVRLRALVVVLVASVLIATGDSTPAGPLVYALPLIGRLRAYARAIAVAPFAIAILATHGAERVWSGPHHRDARHRADWPPIAAGAFLLLSVAGILLLTWLTGPHPARALDPVRDLAVDPAAPRLREYLLDHALRWGEANAMVPLALAVAGALVLCFGGLGLFRSRPRWQIGAIIGLVAVDLFGFATSFNPAMDPAGITAVPASVTFLRGDPAPGRVAIFLGYDTGPLERSQEQLAISWAIPYGIEDINGFNSLQPRRYTDFLFGTGEEDVSYGWLYDERLLEPGNPTLSQLNVRYALIPSHTPIVPDRSWSKVYSSDALTIYRNPIDYGRAFYTDQVSVESDARAVLARVTTSGFDPRRVSFVESPLDPGTAAALQGATPATGAGSATVRVERPSPNELLLHTHTDTPRFLVLSEMWSPGWHAELVGEQAPALPVYRANYLFRGLIVPAGDHNIRIAYRPASAIAGALITVLTIAAGVVACLVSGRARQRGRGRGETGRGAPGAG